MPDFSSYLESVRCHYEQWWKGYAFIDEIDELTWFDFPLSSTTKDKPQKPGEKPTDTPPRLVLEAIHDYAQEKILIVGPPGAGKSTLLANIFRLAAIRAIEDEQAPIPVLIELRDYKAGGDRPGLRGLIFQTLESHDPSLDEEHLKKLLKERKLLLLVDGLNEKPEAQRDLTAFCRNIPLIATSRQNGDGWDIERKLELQPLSTEQVKEFFELQLPNADRKQLQTLGDRVRDFGQTPLMVWMLYSIFRANKDVPETRGEAYRSFTTLYAERAKDGINLSDSRSLLGKLAFEMMRSKKVDDPTHFSLEILEGDALNVLGSEATLKRMLNHLLKQQGKAGNREISFCHQSLQEYYAAEYLLEQIKNLDSDSLQQAFLNYLKWTEPVALMLALVDDEALAVRVVELALDVDLMLGARLAGEVRSDFQKRTVGLVNAREVPSWFKIFLLGKTKSQEAVDKLIKLIKNPDPTIRRRAVWASRELNRELVMAIMNEAIKDSDRQVRETAMRVMAEVDIDCAVSMVEEIIAKELVASVREIAVICVLGKSNSDASILLLIKATQDKENNVRVMADYHLKNIRIDILMTSLSKALDSKIIDTYTRKIIIIKAGEVGNESILPDLFKAQLDLNINIYHEASHAIQKIRERLSRSSTDVEDCRKQQHQIDEWFVHLKSENPIPRGNAVLGLKNLPDKKIATEIMFQALKDPHHYVRGHAIHGIAELIGKESVFELMRALDDQHYDVRGQASQELVNLKQSLPDGLKISENTVFKLIKVLEKEKDTYIRSRTLQTIKDLCTIFSHLSLDSKLEDIFLHNSDDSDQFLRFHVAQGLGLFHSNEVIEKLFQMLKDVDLTVILAASGSLKNMPLDKVVKYLSDLLEIVLGSEEGFALDAILDIQSKCKFYNYEIQQAKLGKADRASLGGDRGDRSVVQSFYGPVYGVAGNVEGDQIISLPPDLLK